MSRFERVRPPHGGEPILHFLRRLLPTDPESVHESTIPLPDEDTNPNRVKFMAGAADGVGVHHIGTGDQMSHVSTVVRHLMTLTRARWPGLRAKSFYRLLRDGPPVLGWIDSFPEQLARSDADPWAVRDVGRWLVTTSPHREPLKFGIVLCGLTGAGADPDIRLIGGHEEFTLYVAVAVQRSVEDPDGLLLELARRVHGWGRVHLVECLVESQRPDARAWLLRGGYRNAVMDEYVAFAVADRCGLRAALDVSAIDEEMLDAAGGLIVALLRGGPAPDMDDYRDGADVVTRYVEHQRQHELNLDRVGVLAEIRRWLTWPEGGWSDREANGWTTSVRDALEAACGRLLDQPTVLALVEDGLASTDGQLFGAADHVAGLLRIDTFERHIALLETDSLRSGSWYQAMRQADEARVDRLLEVAERGLPLDSIATGPGDLLGLGPGFEAHSCLDFIVQDLGRFPGKGWPLVRTALQSPVIRNRNMALNVLNEWGRERWPPDTPAVLEHAVQEEPDAAVRTRVRGLLDDGRLPAE